ncbi:Bifunctional NMN adenylyltransferase/Nudix hydrolase [compost metagenome]
MKAFRYCPHCRTDLVTEHQEGHDRLRCPGCGEMFYRNSKPCAGALVVDGQGRLLLARRAIEPFKGLWDIPGGYLEEGEHPEAGALREVLEETGLKVRITAFVGIYMDTYGANGVSTLNVFYEAEVAGELPETLTAKDDVSELAWFDPDDLPLGEFSFENGKQAIADWVARRHSR